jgi:hypothetical protein
MSSKYAEIVRFVNDYVRAYSEYGQVIDTYNFMDKFYSLEVSFDNKISAGRVFAAAKGRVAI